MACSCVSSLILYMRLSPRLLAQIWYTIYFVELMEKLAWLRRWGEKANMLTGPVQPV